MPCFGFLTKSSAVQNSSLSMKVVEIESRYEQVAAERDKLRHELEAYKEGNIKQQEEYQRHVSPPLCCTAVTVCCWE